MRVWVQMGHCYRRAGSTGTTGEQDYVSRVAKDARDILTGSGHTVTVALADTRPTGGYDLFVALHCDGSVSGSASGASVGYRDSAGKAAADVWKARFKARGWPYGFRGDNYTDALRFYYGTGWASAAGIPRAFVLEHGFLTNSTRDRAWLTSAQGRAAAAAALADTVQVLAGGSPVDDTTEEDDMGLPRKGQSNHEVFEYQQLLWLHAHDAELGDWGDWRLKKCAMAGKEPYGDGGWCDFKFGDWVATATEFLQEDLSVKRTGEPTLQLIARAEARRWAVPRLVNLEQRADSQHARIASARDDINAVTARVTELEQRPQTGEPSVPAPASVTLEWQPGEPIPVAIVTGAEDVERLSDARGVVSATLPIDGEPVDPTGSATTGEGP